MQDIKAMLDLLSEGCKAHNGTHYVHRGDLQWWLFYSDIPLETWLSNIYLWFEGECLIGWALLSAQEQSFDVFVLPHLRNSGQEREILDWSLEHMSMVDSFQSIWIAEEDDVRIRWMEGHGFTMEQEYTPYFKRSLAG
ncbi:MAG TPA: hypothetical protein VKB04_07035, partial [Anaerolineales bacterium]|nr:hypothetical protein [Anaerolineales bacterium]